MKSTLYNFIVKDGQYDDTETCIGSITKARAAQSPWEEGTHTNEGTMKKHIRAVPQEKRCHIAWTLAEENGTHWKTHIAEQKCLPEKAIY